MKKSRMRWPRRRACCGVGLLALFAGCATPVVQPPPPPTTKLATSPAAIPAQMFGNILVVESKWDKYGPYHFLIDTGSSLTLVTPELAARYGTDEDYAGKSTPVRVRSTDGATTLLTRTLLNRSVPNWGSRSTASSAFRFSAISSSPSTIRTTGSCSGRPRPARACRARPCRSTTRTRSR
jgi:hypothetical protein